MTEEQRRQAISRIRAKRGFWMHFASYIFVNLLFVLIWFTTGSGYYWPVWPMLGWGIGLVAHALAVFGGFRPISEEQIQKEIERGI